MNRDDMLKQLGLDDGLAKPTGKAGSSSAKTPTAPAKPAGSPTALDLDKWDIARGSELLSRSPDLKSLSLPEGDNAIADLHAVAFKPYPELADNPADPTRAAFVKALLESGETQALRVSTTLNSLASDIAAVEFARSYSQLLRKLKDQPKKEEGEPEEGEGDEEGEGSEGGEGDGDPTGGAAAMAARAAAKEASKEVEAMEESVAALGYGAGSDGSPPNQKAITEMFHKVRNNPTLRKITELAGRFRRVAQAKQRRKQRHGADETTGITTGGKINRLLSRELSRLMDPDLELDVLRRIVDKQAMIKEVKGKEGVGKGPIIVVVDESGSMEGAPANAAKAFALAMAWVARHQRRWCALVGYTGGAGYKTDPQYRNAAYGSGVRTLCLPSGTRDDDALLGWLLEFMGAGSHIDIPIREMPDIYAGLKAPQGATDVIFITDAICCPDKPYIDRFNAWKKEVKARLITLVINSYDAEYNGVMNSFSDEVHMTSKILEADNEAVGRCLSI